MVHSNSDNEIRSILVCYIESRTFSTFNFRKPWMVSVVKGGKSLYLEVEMRFCESEWINYSLHVDHQFLVVIRTFKEKKSNFCSYIARAMEFNTKVTTILKIQFMPVGIHLEYSKSRQNLIIVVMNFLFVVIGYSLLRNYSYLNSYLYKMDNTVYVVATIFVVNTFWISRYQKELMQKIFTMIAEDEKDTEFAQLIQRFLKPLLFSVTSWHFLALCLTMLFPIFAACFTKAELGSTPTLLFPSWFPWQIRTRTQYILTICLQLVSGSALYFLALTQEIIVVCYAAVVRAHIVRFCKVIREMETDMYLEILRPWPRISGTVNRKVVLRYEYITLRKFRKILVHFLRIRR